MYSNKETTILFGGDFAIDNEINISEDVVKLFNYSDFKILNLEAPIIDNLNSFKKIQKAGLNLYQAKRVLKPLKQLGITHLGCANNHLMDYGLDGFESTKKNLNKDNIYFNGCGENLEEASQPLHLTNQIALISLCEEEFGVAGKNRSGCYSMYLEDNLQQIRNLKHENKFLIIYTHGGGEMIPFPSNYIRDRYRQFIDAGADIVVGHHPHIPQGKELYKNKPILYSLGNFAHYIYPNSWGNLLSITIKNQEIIENKNYNIKFENNKLTILKNDDDNQKYQEKMDVVLKDDLLFNAVYQEQVNYLFENVYKNYFLNLRPKPRNILGKIPDFFTGKDQSGNKQLNYPLLMHLFRNASHREFINTALKLKTKEIIDLRTPQSNKIFNELEDFIKHE